MLKRKTIGKIAKENGFNTPLDYYNHMVKEKDFVIKLKVGDMVILPKDYKPTHFNNEKCLPIDIELTVSEVGDMNIFKDYSIKITGYDFWFNHKLFIKK